MTSHLDLLSRLYAVWGALGVSAAASLALLAAGAYASSAAPADGLAVGAVLLAAAAAPIGAGGVLCLWIARGLARRAPGSRRGALVMSVAQMFLLPFGTALGVYSYWVLLNGQVRGMFEGRASR